MYTWFLHLSLYIYICIYVCIYVTCLSCCLLPWPRGGEGGGGIAEHLVTVALSSYALLHSTSHIYIYIYIFIYVETNVGNVFVLLLPVLYGVGKGEGGIAEHLFTSVLTCMPWCILSVTYVYIHIDAVIYRYINVYVYIYMHQNCQLFALLLLALSGVCVCCSFCFLRRVSSRHNYKQTY